ncbi:zinc-dependent metalloproteinase lipoprotein, family [Cesiribacter andamanensis AMV16]|uniref:Zinc-dependent metalloproteinase lipoprotein, family n=2 Tax=Cesiribacter TaxID=1133570 RepID=M7NRL1_9BACT|nr:zinc-dependent metalloproteinase lipoprotein, family [Cesiribacter andamanensis AMV16]
MSLAAGQEIIRCYTVENELARRRENPQLPTDADFERWIEDKIVAHKQKQSSASRQAGTVYRIPVIVHVVHNGEPIGTGPNIMAAQVYSQIESLNEDLRRQNADRVNTRAIFAPMAADMELEFVPATVDPDGNQLAEPGIRRYHGKRASWDLRDDVEKILKPATIWDPTRYSNMWSASFGGNMAGLLGYAQFPESSGLNGMPTTPQSALTDGTVMVYTSFGCSTKDPGGIFSLRAPYNQGRTTTHEVGHWLGLRHIWGDGGCLVDDFVADTPAAAASNSGCNLTANSCNSNQAGDLPDMVENYMDYSNDGCMNAFTAGQKARTQAVMLNSPRRRELPASTVAGATYHDAGITKISFSKDCDGNISGTALLTNLPPREHLHLPPSRLM